MNLDELLEDLSQKKRYSRYACFQNELFARNSCFWISKVFFY